MALIEYLHTHFLTREQLLEQSATSSETLAHYQAEGMMPAPAYKIAAVLTCHSFFGVHRESEELTFYAKGYVSWLKNLAACNGKTEARSLFDGRYRRQLQVLETAGFTIQHPKIGRNLDRHLDQEWEHFLAGTYGLCTRSGLPEDIAAKEVAILIIEAFLTNEPVPATDVPALARAVDLLDQASAPFAPHERPKSSRHRLVDEVRRSYGLKPNTPVQIHPDQVERP